MPRLVILTATVIRAQRHCPPGGAGDWAEGLVVGVALVAVGEDGGLTDTPGDKFRNFLRR
jgi:hypothetical protein